MPRSPEEAEKAADKLKLEGDARAAFVSRLTAGYVPPTATDTTAPATPKVEAPKAEAPPLAATPSAPKPRYTALATPAPRAAPPTAPQAPPPGPPRALHGEV